MPPVEGAGPGSLAGQLLEDRYRLDSLIAAGGMGEVWRARDELLDRPVAVKLIKDAYTGDEAFLSRFRSEARIAAALSHPGVAHVFDYGERDGFRPFLVMELVDGRQLSALIASAGALPAGVMLDIVAQAARALRAAHRLGVTHRDIKPSNLLITDDGLVKITDFGIAAGAPRRAATAAGPGNGLAAAGGEDTGPGNTGLKNTGLVLGTAAYMSPEQAEGKLVTPASDIYSLGIVAYQCVAGRLPFAGDTPLAVAIAHADSRPRPLPAGIPPGVRDLIMRMIAADPGRRPAQAAEVAESATRLRDEMLFSDGPQLADVVSRMAAGPGGPPAAEDQASTTIVQPAGQVRARPGGRWRRAVIVTAVLGATAGGVSAVIGAAFLTGTPAARHANGHRPVAVAATRTPKPTRRATPRSSDTPVTTGVGASSTAQPPQQHSGPPSGSPPSSPPPSSPVPSPSPTPTGPSPSPSPPPTSPPPSGGLAGAPTG